MQFMTSLFGGSTGTLLNAVFALGFVLVLVVLGLWLMKMFARAGERLGRGNEKRLQIIDSAAVDGKRKVLILRRDNVEHVIMTGGPQDLVIETGIPVADPIQARRPAARSAAPAENARPAAPSEISTPITPDRPVSRDAVDRLRDLARPAPLTPRVALRHTALLRPTSRDETAPSPVIPMGPELAVDNSAGPATDSARAGADGQAGGHIGIGGRNRFFRSVYRDRT